MFRRILPLTLTCSVALAAAALTRAPEAVRAWLPTPQALPSSEAPFTAGHCQDRCTLLIAGVTPTYLKAPVWPYPAAPEDYRGLTDTLMLVHLAAGRAPEVISLPRDTWLERPGFGAGRLNEVNRLGGAEALAQSTEALTGSRPDHVLLLNMHAVRAIVEAAGGIEVDVPVDMEYHDRAGGLDISLKAGRQRLSGVQAEGFLRWRHDGRGDIGRAERQQLFVRALTRQLSQPREWWRASAIKEALQQSSSGSLRSEDLMTLIGILARSGAALAQPETTLLPGSYGQIGEWIPDLGAAHELTATWQDSASAAERKEDTEEEVADALRDAQITVLNAGAPAGSARHVAAWLRAQGFRAEAQNASEPASGTQGPAERALSSALEAVARGVTVKHVQGGGQISSLPAKSEQESGEAETGRSGGEALTLQVYLDEHTRLDSALLSGEP